MVKYNREQRCEHLKCWKESGLSGQEYCRQHEIPPTTFYSWKKAEKKLSGKSRQNGAPEPDTPFVPVQNVFPQTGRDEITIEQDKLRIILPLSVTLEQISIVLSALRLKNDT